ncbi:sulfurtransferase [Leptodesmis sp.]|uniref:sulfurtransferase n=1 Tax=Leptodesmis sp. TaxID=3100501 RepID=UPI0040534F88
MTGSQNWHEIKSLVSPAWLYEHLEHPGIAIADCRFVLMQPELGRRQYQEVHIPGAYYLDLNRDLSSPAGKHGGRHPLPDPALLAEKLAAMGVNSESPEGPTLVIAYDDSRMAFASRLWWLLRYLGHEQVAILDGGFAAWKAAGYPISTTPSLAKSGRFIPKLQTDRAVDIEQVKTRKDLPTVSLVDSREPERYRGEKEPIDPIAGHIPGAVNYPWQEVTTEQGYARPIAEQHDRWAALADSEEIIVYCGSGVTACVNLLSLDLAGIPNAKLYPGSWSDWCSY